MKSIYWVFSGLLLLSAGLIQCSRCDSGAPAGSSGESKGNPLNESQVKSGSVALEWEHVSLGISAEKFKTKTASLFSQPRESLDGLFECGVQQGVWLVRPQKNALLEHTASVPLQFCAISSLQVESSLRVTSIRGDFLNDALFSVQFKFQTVHFDALKSELTARFGQGEQRILSVESVAGSRPETFFLWKVNGVVWALKKNANEVVLQMHADSLPKQLSPAGAHHASASKTDLSDIGLGGSPYDVKLDDLKVPAVLLDSDTTQPDGPDTGR